MAYSRFLIQCFKDAELNENYALIALMTKTPCVVDTQIYTKNTHTHTIRKQFFDSLDSALDLDCLSPCKTPVSSRKSKAIFLQSLYVKTN